MGYTLEYSTENSSQEEPTEGEEESDWWESWDEIPIAFYEENESTQVKEEPDLEWLEIETRVGEILDRENISYQTTWVDEEGENELEEIIIEGSPRRTYSTVDTENGPTLIKNCRKRAWEVETNQEEGNQGSKINQRNIRKGVRRSGDKPNTNKVRFEGDKTGIETCLLDQLVQLIEKDELETSGKPQRESHRRKKPHLQAEGPKIQENNRGYKMLKVMGWEEEKGLGKCGKGLRHPIALTGQLDKTGLGAKHLRPEIQDGREKEVHEVKQKQTRDQKIKPGEQKQEWQQESEGATEDNEDREETHQGEQDSKIAEIETGTILETKGLTRIQGERKQDETFQAETVRNTEIMIDKQIAELENSALKVNQRREKRKYETKEIENDRTEQEITVSRETRDIVLKQQEEEIDQREKEDMVRTDRGEDIPNQIIIAHQTEEPKTRDTMLQSTKEASIVTKEEPKGNISERETTQSRKQTIDRKHEDQPEERKKNEISEETQARIAYIKGNLTDKEWVGKESVIVQQINAVALRPRDLAATLAQAYPYCNVYENRRNKWETTASIADSLIRELDNPGDLVWTEPEGDDIGPNIAAIVGQFLYGMPIDQGGNQNAFIQLGYGTEMVKKKMRKDTKTKRLAWFKRGLKKLKRKLKQCHWIKEVLIPEDIGCDKNGGERTAYKRAILKLAEDLEKMGVSVYIVEHEETKGKSQKNDEDQWKLGEASLALLREDRVEEIPEQLYTVNEEKRVMSYFAEIIIEGVKVKALIDSGASVSILATSVVGRSAKLMNGCVESTKSIKGLGNTKIGIEALLTTDVKIGKAQFGEVNFAVVESDQLPVDAILGMNFLYDKGIVLDMGRGKIIYGTQEESLLCKHARPQPKDIPAYLKNEVRLPPRCRTIVHLELAGEGGTEQTLLVEPYEEVELEEGVYRGRSICKSRNGKVQIPIINTLFSEVFIKPGQSLAIASRVAPKTMKLEGTEEIEAGFSCAVIEEDKEEDTEREKKDENLEKLYNLEHIEKGKEELVKLINQYPEVTSKSAYDIGNCSLPPMEVETGNAKPICIPPRRMGPRQRARIRGHVKDMTEAGILGESDSAWSFPLVPVAKRDGDVRPCVDFRLLNEVTTSQAHPLPNIGEHLSALKGAKFYSTLDLNKGYHQFKMGSKSAPKTAFPFEGTLYHYNRVPFGLKNSAGWFQRNMQLVLAGISIEECLIYLDDILIFSPDEKSHLITLEKVFQRLMKFGLKIKPQKCQIFCREVDFLGHRLGEEGIVPLQTNVKAITEFPRPSTTRQLKRFIGMAGWYRQYIENCSSIMRPLNRATTKNRLVWNEQCQEAFEKVKEHISTSPILAYPDYASSEPLIITSDASSSGAGAYLSQYQEGRHRVISYFSKTFSESQSKYSAFDKELEGIRESVKYFRPHILNRKLVIRTDHRPIRELSRAKHLSPRLYRIYELLGTFDLVIEYLPGPENKIADALSRSTEGEGIPYSKDPVILPQTLKIYRVPGGGDSLTRSFAHAWLKDENRHLEVRETVCKNMMRHPRKYGITKNELKDKKFKECEVEGAPLPLEFLYAVSITYQVTITVHINGTFTIRFTTENGEGEVHLVLQDGVHFNSTIPNEEVEVAMIGQEVNEKNTNKLRTTVPKKMIQKINLCPGITLEQIKLWQQTKECEILKKSMAGWDKQKYEKECKETGCKDDFKNWMGKAIIWEEVLVKEVEQPAGLQSLLVPIVPREMLDPLAEELHIALNHVGEAKVEETMRGYFAAPGLRKAVTQAVQNCEECKMYKEKSAGGKIPPMRIITKEPYELVEVDLAEMPKSPNGN